MEVGTTPEHEAFRARLREWLANTLPAGWADGERPDLRDREAREAFLREWQRALGEGGWTGLAWPEEYGGRGASLAEQVIYEQEMARVDAPPEPNSAGINFVGPTLIAAGTEAQRERFLPPILAGEEMWCQGYSEPGAGSDLAALGTSAEERDGEYVVNGSKIWTSGAHMADWIFLLVWTDDSGPKHHGITVLLAELDQPGVTVEPIRGMDDGYHFAQVFFDDAVADADHVVGEVDEGWSVAMTLSAHERTSANVFKLERRFEEVLAYCRAETRNGRPLVEDPMVRDRLADFDARIRAAKLTYLRHVDAKMASGEPTPEGLMDNVYGRELERAFEAFAQELTGPAAGLWTPGAIADWHPGFPVSVDDPTAGHWINRYLGSFALTIGGGTSDIKRNLIAERVLDLPKGLRSEPS